MDSFSYGLSGFIGIGVMAFVLLMPGLVRDAFTPQPGLEPDRVELFLMSLPGRLKQLRQSPTRLIRHHSLKALNIWRRWQGYKPLVLNRRTVWVPTHTILTPFETF